MKNKVLFVHDGPMYVNSEGEIFGIHYNDKVKNRYLQLGDEVTFCMRSEDIINSDVEKYSKISPYKFRFIPFPNFKSIKRYFIDKPKAKKIINKAVQEHDILVARMPSASAIIAIKAARKLGKPYLVEMVACTYDAYWNYNWKGKLIAHYKLWKTQRVIKDCPYVIYVTKYFLQKRYPTFGFEIGCSDVELNTLSDVILQNRIDKINKDKKSPLTIATVGALDVPYKGQADVIVALSILKKKGFLFNYKLVGQGDTNYLKEIIEIYEMNDQVEIIGALPFDKVFKFLEEIDIYIQPSKQEGLPRALIEAMSLACPSLGARTAGIPELLSSDCVFDAGNISQICDKLINFTKEKMIKEANNNFDTTKEYELSKLEKRRNDFYDKFLNETVKI